MIQEQVVVHTPVCHAKSALGFTVILGNCKSTAREPTHLCKPFPTRFPLFLLLSKHPVSSKEVAFRYFVVVGGFYALYSSIVLDYDLTLGSYTINNC